MGTKNKPGRFDCYANARPDEPMFVLLGRDPIAPLLVRLWAALRAETGRKSDDGQRCAEAIECAEALEAYARGLDKGDQIEFVKSAFTARMSEFGRGAS